MLIEDDRKGIYNKCCVKAYITNVDALFEICDGCSIRTIEVDFYIDR
jgi:hypothetical protein